MQYIYKRDLDKKYKVKAVFYQCNIDKENILCRKVADIKKNGYENAKIDAYFVMMNPGSCKVYDECQIEHDEIRFCESRSDATMARVMNIMEELGWNYVRIINISDIVNGNSVKASSTIAKLIERGYQNHCIFSKERRGELMELTKDEAIYVLAWGCSSEINHYSHLALEYLKNKTYIGIDNGQGGYKHIKPPTKRLQIEIAEQLIEQARVHQQ